MRGKAVSKRVLGHTLKKLAKVLLQNLGQNCGTYENTALTRKKTPIFTKYSYAVYRSDLSKSQEWKKVVLQIPLVASSEFVSIEPRGQRVPRWRMEMGNTSAVQSTSSEEHHRPTKGSPGFKLYCFRLAGLMKLVYLL